MTILYADLPGVGFDAGPTPIYTAQDMQDYADATCALRGAQKESGWRPIETAPKDGRVVLYWVASVRYREDEETGRQHEVDVSCVDLGCWMNGGEHGEGYHDPFAGIPGDQGGVTHWMPLPSAPTSEGEAK